MNYAYDILTNFNKNYFDFFEWNMNDIICNIKKVPVFKVTNKIINDFKYNTCYISSKFLNSIKNNPIFIYKNGIKHYNYYCILCSNNDCVCIKFNNQGKNSLKSSLTIDDTNHILKGITNIKNTNIHYKCQTLSSPVFSSRNSKEIQQYINIKIQTAIKNKEWDKLEFLYLECTGKNEQNHHIIVNTLKKIMLNKKINHQIYCFFQLIGK